MELLLSVISVILVTNIVLNQVVGLESDVLAPNQIKKASNYALLVVLVSFLVTLVTYPIYQFILVKQNLVDILPMVTVLVLLLILVLLTGITKKFFQSKYESLKEVLLYLSINTAIIAIVFVQSQANNYLHALLLSFGSGVGYYMFAMIFSAIKGRYDNYDTPKYMRGLPIALLTIGLIAMAFLGLGGLV